MTKDKNTVPKPNIRDKIHKIAKIGVAAVSTGASFVTAIPLTPLATNLFDIAVKPPVQQRVNNWLNELADRISKLEYDFEELSKNPLFITGLMQAMQIIMRNHQEEKKEALKNAVINMAKPAFTDDNISLMFMSWIDVFTIWHIRVLEFLNSDSIPTKNGKVDMKLANAPLEQRIRKAFPADEYDPDLVRQVLNDLSDRGLIVPTSEARVPEGHAVFQADVRDFGKKFLRFIQE